MADPSPDATFQLPPSDENVERVVLTAEQVVDVMIEADRENRENETDVDWLFVADAVLRAIVPPGSVVVKRDDLERMRDTAHDDERSETANRYLARQEDTQT
jgi:hypothetical protein